MAVKIVIRATLKGNDVGAIRKIHDEVTAATRHMAQEAGDISHHVYLNPQNHRDFLGVDEWKSPEAAAAFASSPQIKEFFGRMFEGMPEVTIWADSGWNQW
jgi:quinol monooxygenase YgiN